MFAAWAALAAPWPKSSANPSVAAAATRIGLAIDARRWSHILLDTNHDRRDRMFRLTDEVHPASSSIAHAHGASVRKSNDLPDDRLPADAARDLIATMIAHWDCCFGVAHRIEMSEPPARPVIRAQLWLSLAEFAA